MAGRPKTGAKKFPDGSPRKGPGSPNYYKWEPFKEGNTAHTTHGAGSLANPGKFVAGSGISRAALQRASDMLEECFTNPAFPEYLRWPMFRIEVESWARVQAQADMVYEWMMALDEEDRYVPQSPNAQKSPMEQWMGIDSHAAKYRARLGLNPTSYAKLRLALGLAKKAEEDDLGRLAEQGAQIRERREAAVIALHAETDSDDGA